MVEAGRTAVSPAGIWVIVVVMVILLAFWLAAIALADRSQARASGRARLAGDTGPALSGAWAGGSVAGAQAPEIPDEAAHEPIRTSGGTPGTEEAQGRNERPGMPRQRSGEGDRAERSYAGQPPPDDEEQDR
jgi:hypothetical protein